MLGNSIIAAICAAGLAWLVGVGLHALRRLSAPLMLALALLAVGATIHAQKANPLRSLRGMSDQSTVTEVDIARGWRVESAATIEGISYAMPVDATVVGNWHRRGTFGEWMRLDLGGFQFPLGTNDAAYSVFSVFSDGKIRP